MSLETVHTPGGSMTPWFSDPAAWPAVPRNAQHALERELVALPDAGQLRASHDLLAAEPHAAGSAGDQRVIRHIAGAFRELGLDVELDVLRLSLPEPVEACVEIISPVRESLPLTEAVIDCDPVTASSELPSAFVAHGASGEATGEVVYANYGTEQDFDTLRELGIDLRGKIVIARYGENFRGCKALFAEQAGAAGLILYTDPADAGYMKGLPYPEGGWANETSIQRGSICEMPFPAEVVVDPTRAIIEEPAPLAGIPVQPIGWGAAQRILARMTGQPLSQQQVEKWQGGLPFHYRLEGGPDLRVHLWVRQRSCEIETANIVATLRGSELPDEEIIIGSHHDAWGCGAGDPLSGMICVLEAARCFADRARAGAPPRRSVTFCAWGAEEFGIIGSTLWCARHADRLARRAVAYINLDVAAMGPEYWCAASPTLRTLIVDAARAVPHVDEEPDSVHDAWTDGGKQEPRFENLGGGSDHIAFLCRLGIPSVFMGGGGCHGVSYHSNYDTLPWYRQVVGEDYASALMVTRLTNIVASRLANAPLLPIDPRRYATEARGPVQRLEQLATERSVVWEFAPLVQAVDAFEHTARRFCHDIAAKLQGDEVNGIQLVALNAVLRDLEQHWLDSTGLPGRAWYRNLWSATDPSSGYAAWVFPALEQAIRDGDGTALARAVDQLTAVFHRLHDRLGVNAAGSIGRCKG